MLDASAMVRPADVLLVGEDPLARRTLAQGLASQPLVRVAADGAPAELPALLPGQSLDAVLWDVGVDTERGLARLQSARLDRLPVLALVGSAEDATDAFGGPVRGVLFRDADPARIAPALYALAADLSVFDTAAATALLRPRPAPSSARFEPLTAREQEVLQLLAEGLSNRGIGERLGISEHTAKFHVNAILQKLGVQSRTEAVVRAVQLGVLLV